MIRPVVAITIGTNHYRRMFSPAAWQALDAFADVIHHDGPEPADKAALIALLPPADACITSWDVAQLDADVMAAAPRLRAMAHMGSSVKRFVSDAVWARDVRVTQRRPGAGRGCGRDHAGADDRGDEARLAAGAARARGRLA